MALVYTVANKVERAYRRGDLFDKRRQLMDTWAKFCAAHRTPAACCRCATQAAAPPVRALHPIRETEVILGLSRASIYRPIARGLLDVRRVLGRRMVTRASIDELVANAPKIAGRMA
jgi:predicted DNA-binding transcriptional regulator AlpA